MTGENNTCIVDHTFMYRRRHHTVKLPGPANRNGTLESGEISAPIAVGSAICGALALAWSDSSKHAAGVYGAAPPEGGKARQRETVAAFLEATRAGDLERLLALVQRRAELGGGNVAIDASWPVSTSAEARAACSDPKLRREALAPAEDPVQLGNERLRVAENRGRYAASSAGDGH